MNTLRVGCIVSLLLLSFVVFPTPLARAECTAAEVCYETDTGACVAWAQVGAPEPTEGTLATACVPDCGTACVEGLCGEGVGIEGPRGCSQLVGDPRVGPCTQEGRVGIDLRTGDSYDLGCTPLIGEYVLEPGVESCSAGAWGGVEAWLLPGACVALTPAGFAAPSAHSCGADGWTGIEVRFGEWWSLGCHAFNTGAYVPRADDCSADGWRGVHARFGWYDPLGCVGLVPEGDPGSYVAIGSCGDGGLRVETFRGDHLSFC